MSDYETNCSNCQLTKPLNGNRCPHCKADYEWNEGNIIRTKWWQEQLAAHEATIAELRKVGRDAASRACSIGQVPSEHYPIFWGDA